MSSFLISIIIPCYNVSRYIDRCIESVVSQTIGIGALEVILVDDASTDDTLSKLKVWESRYPDNIMVITYQENLRQGGARNVGLQYASAPYIGFVDADDWIDAEMYQDLYSHIINDEYDVVKCKLQKDTSSAPGNVLYASDYRQCDHDITFNPHNGFYMAVPPTDQRGINGEYGYIITGLYKRNIIFDNDVFFPEHLAYEDNYWGAVMRLYIHRMYIIDRPYYHYFSNPSSTTSSKSSPHQLDRLTTEVMIIEYYQRVGAFTVFYDELLIDFIQRYYLNTLYILFTGYEILPDIYSELRSTVLSFFPDWYKKYPVGKEPLRKRMLLDFLNEHETCTNLEFQQLQIRYVNNILQHHSCQ